MATLDETVLPFGQLPRGSFFNLLDDDRMLEKCRDGGSCATDDDWNAVPIKDDAPCVVRTAPHAWLGGLTR